MSRADTERLAFVMWALMKNMTSDQLSKAVIDLEKAAVDLPADLELHKAAITMRKEARRARRDDR